MTLPPLLVMRHGETTWNAEGRLQGGHDSPLTAEGRAQARQQNALLRDFGAFGWNWVSSPQGRAVETARIAMKSLARDLRRDPRLSEITLGDWSGQLRDDIAARHPELFETDDLGWYDHAPGGEGLAALADRTRGFLAELSGPTVIVTHGMTSRVLRCHALGRDWSEFGALEGGQGVVYHIAEGIQQRLETGA